MAKQPNHLSQVQHLLQQNPNSEVWRELTEVFATWPNNASKKDVDWQMLLQHLLQQTPDPALWKAILNLFVAWPKNNARTEAIQVASHQLDHWDDVLRHISAGWKPLYERGNRISTLGILARSLQIYRMSEIATQILKSIAHTPHLSNLTRLSIYRCEDIDETAFKSLSQSPYLHKLQHLEIHRSNLGMMDSFYDSDKLDDITRLNKLEPTPMRVYFLNIIQSPIMNHIKSLKLTYLYLKDWYVEELSKSPLSIQINHLNLSENRLAPESAQILANSPSFQNITHLNISHNSIQDQGAQYLARSPYLTNLQELHLVNCDITQAGKHILQNTPHLRYTKIIFEHSQL